MGQWFSLWAIVTQPMGIFQTPEVLTPCGRHANEVKCPYPLACPWLVAGVCAVFTEAQNIVIRSPVCVGLWGGSTMVPHAKCLSIAQFKLKWFQYKASQSLLAFYFSALRLAPFVLHSFPTCDVTIVMLQYQHLLCTKFKHSRMFCLLFLNDHILQFHQVTKGSIQSEPCSWE